MFCKSSECNFAYEYLCTETCGTQNGYGASQFSASMGQPLVYYCLTPQQKFKQRCGNERKDNRNCFTKAFQWYTEEHVPHREESIKKSSDVKGFANWLDSKYEQFLQDQSDTCGYKVKHTSITEAIKFPNEPCEARRKKFRVKSPWRKKRGHKETGDVTSKCSLLYIMKPKDVSRPASETNDMSKAMMMSSEVVLSRCSRSCASLRVLHEPSLPPLKRSQEANQSVNSIKNDTKSLSKMYSGKTQAVTCLCSKVSKRNAYTQSDPRPAKSLKSVPKLDTPCQTVPKSETAPESETASCPCGPSKFTKISHPTKIEIEFESKRSLTNPKCLCSKELIPPIPKTDAQNQFQTDVKTCACGSDHSIVREKSPSMQKKVRMFPCECDKVDFEKCPLEPPVTNSIPNQPTNNQPTNKQPTNNQPIGNQPIHCNQCIPCKRTTVVTDDVPISNRSNKTTPGSNGLSASTPANTKTSGNDGTLAANPTTTNDGVQTSNLTIANDGVQTSNHSIRIEKDGAAAGNPLFMKIIFADKLCKF